MKDIRHRWEIDLMSIQKNKMQYLNSKVLADLWGRRKFGLIHKEAREDQGTFWWHETSSLRWLIQVLETFLSLLNADRTSSQIRNFYGFIIDGGLLDLPLSGARFTWSSSKVNPALSMLKQIFNLG